MSGESVKLPDEVYVVMELGDGPRNDMHFLCVVAPADRVEMGHSMLPLASIVIELAFGKEAHMIRFLRNVDPECEAIREWQLVQVPAEHRDEAWAGMTSEMTPGESDQFDPDHECITGYALVQHSGNGRRFLIAKTFMRYPK